MAGPSCGRESEASATLTLSGHVAVRSRLLFPPGGLGAAANVGGWGRLLAGGYRVLLGGWLVLLLLGPRQGLRAQQGLHDLDDPHGPEEPPEQGGGLQGRQLFPYPVEDLGQGVAGAAGPGRASVLRDRMEEGPGGRPCEPGSPLPPTPACLTPSYLKAKLPEQHIQRWVPQRHGWEEFFHPLASPPLAATAWGAQVGPARRPRTAPGAQTHPCSQGCENQYL